MGEPRIPLRGRAIKPMLRKAYDDESLPPDQRKGGAGEKYAEIPIGIWDLVHLGSPCDRESGARFNVNLGFRCPSPPPHPRPPSPQSGGKLSSPGFIGSRPYPERAQRTPTSESWRKYCPNMNTRRTPRP